MSEDKLTQNHLKGMYIGKNDHHGVAKLIMGDSDDEGDEVSDEVPSRQEQGASMEESVKMLLEMEGIETEPFDKYVEQNFSKNPEYITGALKLYGQLMAKNSLEKRVTSLDDRVVNVTEIVVNSVTSQDDKLNEILEKLAEIKQKTSVKEVVVQPTGSSTEDLKVLGRGAIKLFPHFYMKRKDEYVKFGESKYELLEQEPLRMVKILKDIDECSDLTRSKLITIWNKHVER